MSGYDDQSMVSNSSAMNSFKRIKLSQKSTSPQKGLECVESDRLSKVTEQLIEYEEIDIDD